MMKNLSLILLALISLAFAAIAILPDWREQARGYLQSNKREILAKVQGDVSGKGDTITVLKVMNGANLTLEIYSHENTPALRMQKIKLPQNKDGFFDFQGRVTNLAMYDIDGDGFLEIIAPTFDDNLVPRLNVYKYNSSSQNFEYFRDTSD